MDEFQMNFIIMAAIFVVTVVCGLSAEFVIVRISRAAQLRKGRDGDPGKLES